MRWSVFIGLTERILADKKMVLGLPDIIVVVVFLAVILGTGVYVATREKMTSGNYFLAGRSLSWPLIGASLFAANISTIHLVGLAASGYTDGLVWGNFEWGAPFILIILGLVFAPFYFKNKISTLPEFLERRYSGASRTFLAVMGLFTALMVHIGLSLYAGAVVLEQFFGINIFLSLLVISVIVVIYTVLGGLKSVVMLDAIQSSILLVGAVIMTVFALLELPKHGIHKYTDLVHAVRPGQLDMLQSGDQASGGLTWYAVLLGYPILGIWYWCGDQTIVQRVLGAKSKRDAMTGPVFAGFLKILPVFIMVFPGVLGYVLFKDIIGENSNDTLPVLINQLLPAGLRGLVAAALLAAVMSTVSSALNSSGTLVAIDIFKRIKPNLSGRSQLLIGRVSTLFVMVLAMLWSTQGGKFTSIFEAINTVLSMVSPPIATVFILGVFWKRGTRQAAFSTLVLGFVLGVVVFCINFFKTSGDGIYLIQLIRDIHFLMQAVFLFIICTANFVVVSFLTPPPSPKAISTLTLEKPMSFITKGKLTGYTDPRLLAGLLVVVMAILYLIFG
ncbi:sodium:solute symporter [Mariniphaga sediminis]|nr:sodium:solute symporter [Mariniphaga sediminis]